jgi:dolichyl-phosphate beta-glucosyltransferase
MLRSHIVVPCYNETARLDRPRFHLFCEEHPRFRFLFVNDGSTDATGAMLDEMQTRRPNAMSVFHLDKNRGKAEAVRQGMLRAFDENVAAVGFWDADLSTPLDAIPLFQDVLDRRADVSMVLGTRLPLLGRTIERRWVRQKLGRLFGRCASWVLGLPIYDTQCGAKLLRKSPATRQLFVEPFSSRWIFDVEMLMRWRVACGQAGAANSQLFELPLEHWREVKGSKLKSTDFLKAVLELWTIHSRYAPQLRGETPPQISSEEAPRRAA